MFARTRIAVLQSAALVAALVALIVAITVSVSGEIRARDEALYAVKLAGLLSRFQAEQAAIEQSGMGEVEAYVQGVQKTVLEGVGGKARSASGEFLLVLDERGAVVLHPALPAGSTALASEAWVKALGASHGDGVDSLDAVLDGEPTWLAHAHFEPWRWTVAYAVPTAVRSAAVWRVVRLVMAFAAAALLVVLGINWVSHRTVSRAVAKLTAESRGLRQAVAEGRLDVRGDAAGVEAEFRPIVEGMNETLDAFAGPFRLTADYVERIARGDVPPALTVDYRGDFAATRDGLNRAIAAIRLLVADASLLAQAGAEGRLSTRADASRHQGDFRAVVQGVNDTLDAVIQPLAEAARQVAEISEGRIPPPIRGEFRGDFAPLKLSLERCASSVQALLADAEMLATAGQEGRLATRADAARHQGEFRAVIEGVNRTLDAVTGPLTVAAGTVDALAGGRVPERISGRFPGDFEALRRNLNGCLDAVARLVEDTNGLAGAAVAGRLSTRADPARHEGEFRRIVEGVNALLDATLAPVDQATRALEALAGRDLRVRVSGDFAGDHARVARAVNATASALDEALSQVSTAVGQVSGAARQIAASSQAVASGANQQATSLEETSGALDRIGATARMAADAAQRANDLTRAAGGAADAGTHAVAEVQDAMGRIRTSAEGTSQIVRDINDIAFQTNMLALNAAVEAARAGQAGVGFAVVAQEVGTLAQRCKEAARKTEALIRESVRLTEVGEQKSRLAADRLAAIVSGVAKVTTIVAEIAGAARDQAAGIGQVNGAVGAMDKVVHQNAASAEESSSAASELNGQAEELADLVGRFQLGGDGPPGAPTSRHRTTPPGPAPRPLELT